MNTVDVERLRQIKTLPSLVKFLRDELDWPVQADEIDDLYFDYTPEELGLDAKHAAKIKEIKQLRSFDSKQPWGIFWVSFEKKRLPMVVLRRILGNLIIKRRAAARKADRPSWHLHDLLFISSYGEEEHRTLSFAHFTEDPVTEELPDLRVLGWDDQNSIMHLDRVANKLHTHLRWPDNSDDVDAWRQRWSDAFTDRYLEAIRSADELIPRLAHLAANIRRRVRDVLDAETERGPMRRIFAAVQRLLIHDMNEDGFADMYAQTVAYGLLSARFSRPVGLTAQNLVQLTAVSNPFLENLLENLFRLNRGKFHFDVDEVGINDVLDLLRNTNMEAIKAAFSDKNPAEDPVIRFYEGFLKQYDPQQRVKRGVFFTPRPVVSYIVRSVHELLQTEFGLADGLASIDTWADMRKRFADLKIPQGAMPDDPFVCILDPATGTGTFLFECIEIIERTMKEKWCRELGKKIWNDPEIIRRWQEYVPKHLLPRLYGYELMMAPYAIAHLKLSLKLGETGYQFHEGDRLHIYLTNSLEPPTKLADLRLADMFSTLAAEAQEVNEIKTKKRFTVVIGNPPYAGHSQNNEIRWIVDLVKDFTYEESSLQGPGQGKWLQDDYVKFMRLAQFLITQLPCGIVGMITNHRYLTNRTFKGMRRQWMTQFESIRVLDLHGNNVVHEVSPLGHDKNVFDIEQGVAIGLFARQPKTSSLVQYAELWGYRIATDGQGKYDFLGKRSALNTSWQRLNPVPPDYLFVPRSEVGTDLRTEFDAGLQVPQLMPGLLGPNGKPQSGLATMHDNFAMGFTVGELKEKIRAFVSTNSREEAAEIFGTLCNPAQWKYSNAKVILSGRSWHSKISKIHFAPFDFRFTVYDKCVAVHLRRRLSDHLFNRKNICLVIGEAGQEISGDEWDAVSCVNGLLQLNYFRRNGSPTLPLYLYDDEPNLLDSRIGVHSRPNFNADHLKSLAMKLGLNQVGNYGFPEGLIPEDVFYYTYAVFHSPGYRSRYAEFLKTEFPRLPLTSSLELFRALAALGADLVTLHLMASPKLDSHITKFIGSIPSGKIEKVTYSDKTVWVDKAQTEGFCGVPENVWNFHIGGYQVCEKWLKDRKGRNLSADDITHYQKIVVALNETIRIMAEIDDVINAHGGWPDAFS
jgi:hypothetical protein